MKGEIDQYSSERFRGKDNSFIEKGREYFEKKKTLVDNIKLFFNNDEREKEEDLNFQFLGKESYCQFINEEMSNTYERSSDYKSLGKSDFLKGKITNLDLQFQQTNDLNKHNYS